MKNDDLKNLINAEIKTEKKKNTSKIKSPSNNELYWLVIVGAAASNIFIWPPRVGIVQPNIPLSLSENIWGCEVMRTQLARKLTQNTNSFQS